MSGRFGLFNGFKGVGSLHSDASADWAAARAVRQTLKSCAAMGAALSLIACGGGASSVPQVNSANGVFVKSMQFHGARLSASQVGASSSLRRVRDASQCTAKDFALGASDDVWMWAQGTLGNGSSFNYGATDDSLGYSNFVTSPLAAYTVSETQANNPDPNAEGGVSNLLKSFVVTTYGNTTVTMTVPAQSTDENATLSIVDNGTPMNSIPLNQKFTLSRGEVIMWTGSILTESITDPSTGANLSTIGQYYTSPKANLNFIDFELDAWDVEIGGYLVTTALNAANAGYTCPAPAGSTPIPGSPPTPVPAQTPTPAPGPTNGCTARAGSTPNPHPTQNTGGQGCTS